jgi:hypothetical protein
MITRINSQHTKRTHNSASTVLIQALRSELHERAPKDFDVWFMDDLAEVTVGWVWLGDARNRVQKELRAPTICALLVKWQAIDWKTERLIARQEAGQ